METKQRILESTIEFIAKNGYSSVTNRKIAEFAQVNSASINYYFNAQEFLLNQALKTAVNNALESIEFYLDPIRINKKNNLGKAVSLFFNHLKEEKIIISAVLIDPANDIIFREKTRKRYSTILYKIYRGILVTNGEKRKRDIEFIFYKLIALSLSILFSDNELSFKFENIFNEKSTLTDIEEELNYSLQGSD